MLGRSRKERRSLEHIEETTPAVPVRRARSLVRDVLLVVLQPDRGKTGTYTDLLVAAALLVELSREGRLDVRGEGKQVRVTVRDTTPLGDEDLDDALLSVRSGMLGDKASRLLQFLPPTTEQVLGRMADDGLVDAQTSTRMGMFTVHRYYPTPASDREDLTQRLRRVLLGESAPDERTALLVSILAAGASIAPLVPRKSFETANRASKEVIQHLAAPQRALVEALERAVDRENSAR